MNLSNPSELASPPPGNSGLRRTLSATDLVIYGLIFMGPIAPLTIYAYVADAAGGMVALAYIVGMIAMLFTAASYKALSEDFPMGGSAYTYARLAIGNAAGFVAGWMMFLDYLLVPALTYVVTASALTQLVPALPRWFWIVTFLGVGVVVNFVGIKLAAVVNKLLLVLQLAALGAFVVAGSWALHHGAGAGHLTLAPLYRPGAFSPQIIFSAVSICSLAFLGFDAISTLSEEVRGDSRRIVGRATVLCLLLAGALFVLQTWIAADLSAGMKFKSMDTAFYEIAELAGGKPLALFCAWTVTLVVGVSSSTVALPAIARLVLSMARDGRLPATLAAVHPRFQTPHRSLIAVSALSLALSFAFLNHLDVAVGFINFGALTGFLILQVAVIVHFAWRKRSHAWFAHVVSPVLGFCILAFILSSMSVSTWALGGAWLLAGVVYNVILGRSGRGGREVGLTA
jgi:amino acid transporter